MMGVLFFLQFMAVLFALAFSFASVQKVQHDFFELARQKENPNFPLTVEEVQDAVWANPNQATMTAFQITKEKLKLIRQHHQDKELEQLAHRLRVGMYRIAALFGFELLVFGSVFVWKTLGS